MAIDPDIAADGKAIVDDAGEAISYKPKGKPAVSISAIVERPGAKQQENERALGYALVMYVAIADIAEIDTNGDTVRLPRRVGEDPQWFPVTSVLEQDAGLWKLAVGK